MFQRLTALLICFAAGDLAAQEKTKDEPVRDAKQAIAMFVRQARPALAKRSERKYVEGLLKPETLSAKKITFAAAFERIDGTLSAEERKTLILVGKIANLKRDGECWEVMIFGNIGNGLEGYLDPKTGRLIILWIVPEG
jgi:hypothetical protein